MVDLASLSYRPPVDLYGQRRKPSGLCSDTSSSSKHFRHQHSLPFLCDDQQGRRFPPITNTKTTTVYLVDARRTAEPVVDRHRSYHGCTASMKRSRRDADGHSSRHLVCTFADECGYPSVPELGRRLYRSDSSDDAQ